MKAAKAGIRAKVWTAHASTLVSQYIAKEFAMKNWLIALCLALLFGVAVHAEEKPSAFYVVQKGDTLSNRFGVKAGKQVCELNKLAACDKIITGQKLSLPGNVGGRIDVVVAPSASQSEKEFRWTKVGGAPLAGCGKKDEQVINEEAWGKLGLTDGEKSEIRAKIILQNWDNTQFVPGMRLLSVAFCEKGTVAFRKNVITAWHKDQAVWAKTFVLTSGKKLHWVRNCGNWVPDVSVTPVVVVPVEHPKPKTAPQQELPQEDEIATMVIPKSTPKEQRCILDPKLVLGQEHEPTVDGNNAHSTFLTAAVYCTKRDKDGIWGVGVGLQASDWNGRVNSGIGRFVGHSVGFGPAIERISDKGWTFEGKLLFGRMHQEFKQAQYANDRAIDFIGLSVAYNDYARRDAGKKWMPETRAYAFVGVPTSVKAHASNFGIPADASDLEQRSVVFQAGVHQDIYDAKYATFWARAGYFSEAPFSETADVRIGFSDPLRVCGVGVGLDFDLKHGGEAFGYGWWCDGIKGIDVARQGYRLNQVSDGKTATFDNGTVMTPLEPEDD